ncbi:hypothetical protein BXZ70DRAFT_1016070 [Cristinia sonorae]|uniref:DUF6533 domain-containing protein n=1 Tax=Cristinia sonorae TaxID=1940300 RepID=A0A8K0XRB3_9AGAR|nr:hypothetical protein BXZ70DRAFT_1016070 [Cristinia sonorae]
MAAVPPEPEVAALITGASHLIAAKYYATASFVMMVYDITLTFPLELEKIWKQKFSGVTVLWFMRYFRYPGYIATIQRVVIGTIFILRMYSIYGRNLFVAGLIFVSLFVEVVVKLYATIAWGQAITLPPGFVACVLTVAPANSARFIIFWVFELVTDTLVLFLTLLRSFQLRRSTVIWQSQLWHVLVKDGLVYFFVMFIANLTTVIMYITAPEDLKAINADFGVMINAIMTARMILNLKTANSKDRDHKARRGEEETETMLGQWEARVMGNIGYEFEGQYSPSGSVYSDGYTVASSRRVRPYSDASTSSDTHHEYEMQHRR